MFWKLFSSERRVQQALDQSVGYDISPNILHAASDSVDAQPAAERDLWKDYAFIMPANTQDARPRAEERRERKKA